MSDTENTARSSWWPPACDSFRAWRRVLVCTCIVGGACSNTTLDIQQADAAPPAPVPVPVPDGLLAHWALDESLLLSTSFVADSSGFGNHGTPSLPNPPTPTTDVPPVRFADPYSMSFNGQDQYIQMGNPALLNIGGPTTMAAWIRPTASDGTRNIVAHGYRWDPAHDFALRIKNGSYVFTTWDDYDHAAIAPVPEGDLGTWVHLCGVFDGASYRLYRNGVQIAANADSTLPPSNIDAIWAIGARAPYPPAGGDLDYLWQGQIDDVRLYARALGAEEILALYQR